MADIELIVKIPEEAYKLLNNEGVDWLGAEHILNAVANGTLLPKEYGDLVDRNAINDKFYTILAELEALPNKPTHKEVLNIRNMCLDTAEPIIKHNYKEMEENTDGGSN